MLEHNRNVHEDEGEKRERESAICLRVKMKLLQVAENAAEASEDEGRRVEKSKRNETMV
jgi:hypothetical protein